MFTFFPFVCSLLLVATTVLASPVPGESHNPLCTIFLSLISSSRNLSHHCHHSSWHGARRTRSFRCLQVSSQVWLCTEVGYLLSSDSLATSVSLAILSYSRWLIVTTQKRRHERFSGTIGMSSTQRRCLIHVGRLPINDPVCPRNHPSWE